MALGTLKLPLSGNKFYEVTGGPYVTRPPFMFGVKMAKEIQRPCDVNIPTLDFQTPPQAEMSEGLRRAVATILKGKPVYVGCMAGRGRTGLFLAVLAKAFGIKNPVEYVREHYFAHAVETEEQYEYVMKYQIDADMQRWVKVAKLKSFFRFKNNLTNQ